MKKLILVGGGGHCKSVIDVAESAGFFILGILDRPENVGKRVLGYEVIGTDNEMLKYSDEYEFIVTVGQVKSPDLRIRLHKMLEDAGCKIATIISPIAHVSKYATIGEGSVVMHKALVNADAKVGKGCIINTASIIEHEVVIGDFCHISTGACINGGANIGRNTFIGSRSIVNQNVTIGEKTIIGSGAVVVYDQPSNCVAVGVPAKLIKINN